MPIYKFWIVIQIQGSWMQILIWITTKLPSFQCAAAAEAVLSTSVMKEPCL